jgi:hypothetical protein
MATSTIIMDGKVTDLEVTGAVLEAAVTWRDQRLLFLTDDILHEDMLRIYLLDAQHRLLDTAVLGAAYSTGAFSDLRLLPPNSLSFSFIGDITWLLLLLSQREFAVPWLSDPRGVSRPWKFHRSFRLEGKPLPDAPASA